MKEGGWALIVLGIIALLIGAMMDVSVAIGSYGSSGTYLPGGGYLPPVPSSVANIHKMHIQALVIQGGLAVILCGVILTAAGGDHRRDPGSPQSAGGIRAPDCCFIASANSGTT
jgi:hypothetical protein